MREKLIPTLLIALVLVMISAAVYRAGHAGGSPPCDVEAVIRLDRPAGSDQIYPSPPQYGGDQETIMLTICRGGRVIGSVDRFRNQRQELKR